MLSGYKQILDAKKIILASSKTHLFSYWHFFRVRIEKKAYEHDGILSSPD